MAGYIPRWFTRPQTVTHPSINRARRRVTTLIETNALPLSIALVKFVTSDHKSLYYGNDVRYRSMSEEVEKSFETRSCDRKCPIIEYVE